MYLRAPNENDEEDKVVRWKIYFPKSILLQISGISENVIFLEKRDFWSLNQNGQNMKVVKLNEMSQNECKS